MPQPYYTPTQFISIPKLVNRNYYIKLAGTSDDIFRVPADASFLRIKSALARTLRLNFDEKRTPDGLFRLEYKTREPMRINLTLEIVDERDWERLLGWQYLAESVSLMEVHNDDVGNPVFFQLGPVRVTEWKIMEVSTTHSPGNINTGECTVVLEESSFVDDGTEDLYDNFFKFKYMIEVANNGTHNVPSSWNPTSPEDGNGLLLNGDPRKGVSLDFTNHSIAYGAEIIEYKGRNNISISLDYNTSNLDEISLLEWAKDSVTAVKLWEWSLSTDVSNSDIVPAPLFIEGRPFQIALTNAANTYSGTGSLDPITPKFWRITDLSYSVDSNSEYSVSLTLKELY